jgi:hypothetical protein
MQRKRYNSQEDENPTKKIHKQFSGGCLCGAIEVILRHTKPIAAFYCHCSHCRYGIHQF